MKKYFFIPLLFLLFAVSAANAQVTTKYGDVVSTLDGIMKAYYDVVSVKKGERPIYERDSMLHIANPQVGISSVGKDGKIVLKMMSLKKYHDVSDEYLAKNGFDEKEISRTVEQFGSIYHVWSTYESRNEAGGPVIERGINSIELFFDGTRFWVITWVFDSERKDNPIPKEYLSKQN